MAITSIVPFAFLDEGCDLRFRHLLGLKILKSLESVNLAARIEYGTIANEVTTMTHRFMKVGTGSQRLEIGRDEDTDEGVNLNWVQKHCARNGSGSLWAQGGGGGRPED